MTTRAGTPSAAAVILFCSVPFWGCGTDGARDTDDDVSPAGGADAGTGATSSGGWSGSGANAGVGGFTPGSGGENPGGSGAEGGAAGAGAAGAGGGSGGADACAPLSCEELGECQAEPDGDSCLRTCAFGLPLVLETPADVEALAALQCHVISPSLTIMGEEIEDLDGLQSVRKIEQDLSIEGTVFLSDLDVFSSMEELGGLTLLETEGLETVSFPALTSLQGLSLQSNIALLEVQLPLIQEAGNMRIYSNEQLTEVHFDALQKLTELSILFNNGLSTLEGFSSLSQVASLIISYNPSLPQCDVDEFAAMFGGCSVPCTDNDQAGVCD